MVCHFRSPVLRDKSISLKKKSNLVEAMNSIITRVCLISAFNHYKMLRSNHNEILGKGIYLIEIWWLASYNQSLLFYNQ